MRADRPTGDAFDAATARRKELGRSKVALVAGGAGALVGLLMFVLSVFGLGEYGFFVFLSTPTAMGLASGFLLETHGIRDATSRVAAGLLGVVFCAALLLLIAAEGAICLFMAAPLAIPLNLLGVWIGAGLAAPWYRPPIAGLILLCIPLALGADHVRTHFPVRPVVTRVEIDAPPQVVWRHVVDFDPLPAPRKAMFRVGIAHPIGARIEGDGVGAIRYCEFSTGPFVEPITLWDPPRRLAFDVAAQPEPMHEWSPYSRVNAPHLLEGLKSHRGEFLLTALPGERTLLQGTTWYEVRMSPHPYWRAWSDYLIGGIHRRVLNHVKSLAEAATAGPTGENG